MKPIVGFEDYLISEDGRVFSSKRGKELIQYEKKGYLNVYLYDGHSRRKFKSVHRLVAEAYIPNPNNLPEVNHKDEDSQNNHASNLEWCTSKYNANYGTHKEKLRKACAGANNPFFGKTHTEQQREKMRAAKVGKPSNNRTAIIANGVEYPSLTACAKAFGISVSYLRNIKSGNRKNKLNIKFE